jgi:Zn-dependent protease with chaperone function
VIRRGLLEQPSVEALRAEVGHEYSHTFKPPTATVVVVALAALLVAELATLVVSLSSHAPLRAIALGVSFLASGAGGGALILRLSQGEELRADRQAAELLGSAGAVIAMLEQLRADCRALGIDADRWRLSDRLFGTHPPVEVRIRALSRSPERSRAGSGLSSQALGRGQSPRSDPAAESHSA